MARIFKLELELWEPSETRALYCVETHETVRRARKNRVLHFGLAVPLAADDVQWMLEVIEAEIRTLTERTLGVQERLSF